MVCSELLGGVISWDQHALTRGRYFSEQVNKGFHLAGWEWLVGGLDALQELAMHPLPEDDPETRDMSAWRLGGKAGDGGGWQEGSAAGSAGLGGRGHEDGHAVCAKKRCPLGRRPELLRQRQQLGHAAAAAAAAARGHGQQRAEMLHSQAQAQTHARSSAEDLARAREELWGTDDS
jgi:hypothetical protein